MADEDRRRADSGRWSAWWAHIGMASAGLVGVPFPVEYILAREGGVDWDAELVRLLETEQDGGH